MTSMTAPKSLASNPQDATPLLQVEDMSLHFNLAAKDLLGSLMGKSRGVVRAVDGVSFSIKAGETLAVVGESGCGKTTLGRVIAGLYAATGGRALFRGQEISAHQKKRGALKAGKEIRSAIQIVFQDPFSSLNPRMTIGDIITEPLNLYKIGTVAERRERARELIQLVGLPVDALNRYPHEFSGGQRQRIAIARALAPNPALIIADEPLSALDVSIQSQILNLMDDLRAARGMSYLFISHDLAVVHHIADRVAVMYLGRIVEIGGRDEIFNRPSHPYTQALLQAIPRVGQGKRRRGRSIQGDVPSPVNPPSGCYFHPRCPKAQDICKTVSPVLEAAPGRPGQFSACHFKD